MIFIRLTKTVLVLWTWLGMSKLMKNTCRLDEHTAVLTFINEDSQNAIESILFKYNDITDKLTVFSSIFHQNSGAQSLSGGSYSFIKCRAFSPTRFGVLYLASLLNRCISLMLQL